MKFIKLLLIVFVLIKNATAWEDVHIICPTECTCKQTHFMDLPIARWINHKETVTEQSSLEEDAVNNNEAMFAGDDTFLRNPLVKFAMCFLQSSHHPKDLLSLLPQDTQALVIMYNGLDKNVSVSTSEIKVLSELTTLEIRGSKERSFHIIIDEPLDYIQNVNFEYIKLTGSETLKRNSNSVHPSEIFDYIPDSEKVIYNVTVEHEVELDVEEEEEVEILPYDVYIMEMRKSLMPSFYGWNNLAVLRIHNCKLDELSWEMFDGLQQLQHLSFDYNEIKIVPPFAFYGAMHVKTLSLAHNFILDLNYRSLAGLLDLEYLDLSDNSISKLSELTFPPFPKLRYVDFRNNPIRFVFPDTFGVMNKTETLLIGSEDTELELSTVHPFKPMGKLRTLTIFNAKAEVLGQNVFMGLKSLDKLKLQGNISKIEFDAFSEMPKLQELILHNCSLNEISMDAFIGCPHLKIIDLSNNNISYLPPGLFDDLNHLTEIFLQKNRLRFLPSNFFSNQNLKLVQLNENPWKCSCEMITWDPDLTNQRRGSSQQKCVREFHTGKLVSCRTVDEYKYDKTLAPRCANAKNRSVYNVLRKMMKCGPRKKNIRKPQLEVDSTKLKAKYKQLEAKQRKGVLRSRLLPVSQKASRKISDEIRKTRNDNSLKHLSSKNNANIADSSHILGNIDSYESFNYI